MSDFLAQGVHDGMAAQFAFANKTFKNIRFYNSQYIDVEKHALYCDPANCFEEECRQKRSCKFDQIS